VARDALEPHRLQLANSLGLGRSIPTQQVPRIHVGDRAADVRQRDDDVAVQEGDVGTGTFGWLTPPASGRGTHLQDRLWRCGDLTERQIVGQVQARHGGQREQAGQERTLVGQGQRRRRAAAQRVQQGKRPK